MLSTLCYRLKLITQFLSRIKQPPLLTGMNVCKVFKKKLKKWIGYTKVQSNQLTARQLGHRTVTTVREVGDNSFVILEVLFGSI